jgi:hypothetical protein
VQRVQVIPDEGVPRLARLIELAPESGELGRRRTRVQIGMKLARLVPEGVPDLIDVRARGETKALSCFVESHDIAVR